MNPPARTAVGPARRQSPLPTGERPLWWAGRFFYWATVAGLGTFGLYIVLRAAGATPVTAKAGATLATQRRRTSGVAARTDAEASPRRRCRVPRRSRFEGYPSPNARRSRRSASTSVSSRLQ